MNLLTQDIEDPRRRILVRALTLGMMSALSGSRMASAAGDTRRLPAGRSIYRLDGTARVNGTAATPQSVIRPGDRIETGPDSELIFAVGSQAMIMRSDTQLMLEKSSLADALTAAVTGLRLLTGKILSVSRDAKMKITTPTATIGVRGTGWYAEADPDKTYFCTCYGVTDVSSSNAPDARETVVSEHHDRPLYILAKDSTGKFIQPGPFINHTDQELMLIEELVGRTPPFVFPNDAYSGPRRDY